MKHRTENFTKGIAILTTSAILIGLWSQTHFSSTQTSLSAPLENLDSANPSLSIALPAMSDKIDSAKFQDRSVVTPDEAAFTRFNTWAEAYLNTSAGTRIALESAGATLALERRNCLKELIQNNPQRALEHAAPYKIYATMPPAVSRQLETRIGALATLGLVISRLDDGTMHQTNATMIDGVTYNAHLFGRRQNQTTRNPIPVQGIALDSELALSENPARMLDVDEAAAYRSAHVAARHSCPVSGQDTAATAREALVNLGGNIVFLCFGDHLAAFNAQHIALEGGTTTAENAAQPMPLSWTTGNKTVLYIMVQFSDQSDAPQTLSAATDTMNNVSNWFSAASYGLLTMTPR